MRSTEAVVAPLSDDGGLCRHGFGGNALTSQRKLARSERFERPTLRFVV